MDGFRACLLGYALVLLGGCGNLLPSERAEVSSTFRDYLDAETAFARATPGRTTRSELFTLGFDPQYGGNGRILSFLDVRTLFVQPNIPIDYLPDSLVTCLEAKERCNGYAFEFTQTDSQRVGSFWADVLNFRKNRQIQGWNLRAVFVLVDDVLVHKVSNGEPQIRRYQVQRNPLGPLQGAGEFLSDQLK
ncbi:hypothetical protein [Pseudomonas oligotrophica]|uniref:hypothetical protein n=1 Tax=Pseudomonas oligotrophica TaxID=2912055 RepID=UPI001F288F2F|nr:hypothetical protein [Pseudomonas oligotrophica]MCF7203306.1 hypothetical protein [Pseudomonas oligotrophica]